MDLDAVLARKPQIALVDELAHTNVPGSRNAKRWQDVEELLDAGIDVISTVNIQHLESLNDVVEKITGVPQRETVPDAVVRAADQVELVDMTPEALRRRMAHGNIYPPEKIDAALTNYFRRRQPRPRCASSPCCGWPTRWTRACSATARSTASHGTWEARERVVVALTGGPEGETLIRRAARIAARSAGGDLLAVHVTRSDGLTGADPARAGRAAAAGRVARRHLPPGRRRRHPRGAARPSPGPRTPPSWCSAPAGGPGCRPCSPGRASAPGPSAAPATSTCTSSPTRRWAAAAGCRGRAAALTLRRQLIGLRCWPSCSLPLLTLVLVGLRGELNLTSDVLMFLVAVVVVALVGGFVPALLAAVAGVAAAQLLLHPADPHSSPSPRPTTPSRWACSSWSRSWSARWWTSRPGAPARRRGPARSRSCWRPRPGSVLRGERAVHGRCSTGSARRSAWTRSRCWNARRRPGGAAGPGRRVGRGRAAPASRPLRHARRGRRRGAGRPTRCRWPCAAGRCPPRTGGCSARSPPTRPSRWSSSAWPPRREAARPIADADRMRTALLAAVSHDLRTPLASAKAAVTSLRSPDVHWTDEDRDELLATADESLDRLAHLVDNLLDMSRLQAGALSVFPRPAGLEEIVARALDDLGPAGRAVVVDIPDSLPEVRRGPGASWSGSS